ncbi:Response regulator receiver domain-containing protein [Chitinophaga sp. CF118]|uniref:response regulator transcription factor n=1 Tax=Chitinophaga sp. CF118 TaxID=1884367 RepID=UPI0008F00521|nr:response regulator transcription factor [Chitinophaga sp. CF118]SFD76289.1 Response regulator receiver domain-containing protein [Chitinophaga sp. CF118]
MRILVAEDDQLILKTLEFRLRKDGHEVIATQDGREALRKIDELLPDLVITDIMMPFASGLEITSAVKEKYPDRMHVIVISGMGQENVVLEAFQLGADDYITKPFSPVELSIRVKRFAIPVKI